MPTPPDQALVRHVIGAAAGERARPSGLKDGMSVGVGWGRTLRLILRSVPRRPLQRVSVVSLLGGLTRGSAVNPHETASHLADLIDAQCYYIAAPALADSEADARSLVEQPMISDVFERAAQGRSRLRLGRARSPPTAPSSRSISSTEAEAESRCRKPARSAISALHWLDVKARLVDHPLNKRAVACRRSITQIGVPA